MLERFALAAQLGEFAKAFQRWFGYWTIKIEIQLHSIDLENMGDEVLHVQSGVLDFIFFEIFRSFFEGVENGRHGLLWRLLT